MTYHHTATTMFNDERKKSVLFIANICAAKTGRIREEILYFICFRRLVYVTLNKGTLGFVILNYC